MQCTLLHTLRELCRPVAGTAPLYSAAVHTRAWEGCACTQLRVTEIRGSSPTHRNLEVCGDLGGAVVSMVTPVLWPGSLLRFSRPFHFITRWWQRPRPHLLTHLCSKARRSNSQDFPSPLPLALSSSSSFSLLKSKARPSFPETPLDSLDSH